MQDCRLIYKSDTSWDLLSPESLAQLVSKSARNNEAANVTGLLTLSGENFLQVLEGPAEAVNRIYTKIVADRRHTNVTLISYEQGSPSQFSEWHMHVLDLADLPMKSRSQLRERYDEVDGSIRIPDDAEEALALLHDVRKVCLAESGR